MFENVKNVLNLYSVLHGLVAFQINIGISRRECLWHTLLSNFSPECDRDCIVGVHPTC